MSAAEVRFFGYKSPQIFTKIHLSRRLCPATDISGQELVVSASPALKGCGLRRLSTFLGKVRISYPRLVLDYCGLRGVETSSPDRDKFSLPRLENYFSSSRKFRALFHRTGPWAPWTVVWKPRSHHPCAYGFRTTTRCAPIGPQSWLVTLWFLAGYLVHRDGLQRIHEITRSLQNLVRRPAVALCRGISPRRERRVSKNLRSTLRDLN